MHFTFNYTYPACSIVTVQRHLAKVLENCPAASGTLLNVLLDAKAAQQKAPGWSNEKLAGKAFYKTLEVVLVSQQKAELADIAQTVELLHDKPEGLDKTRAGRTVQASIELLNADVKAPLHALTVVILGMGALKDGSASGSVLQGDSVTWTKGKDATIAEVRNALTVVKKKTSSDQAWFTDVGFKADFVGSLTNMCESALSAIVAAERASRVAALETIVAEAAAALEKIPDPSVNEKTFITHMKSSGARLNATMKKVLSP